MVKNKVVNNYNMFNPYTTYITKVYRVIPKNCALIVRNKFNGESVKVKTGGFAFIAPWSESKLVSLAIRNIDYEKLEFDEKDNLQITVDVALSVRVVDPIKYEYSHQNIQQELKVRIYSMMRVLVRKASYEELSRKHFELPRNDINMDPRCIYAGGKYYYSDSKYKDEFGNWKADPITEFDLELYNMRRELNEFASQFGLEVVSLRNKEVQQSREMQEADDRIRQAEKAGREKEIEAEYARKVAEKRAAAMKIEQEAYNSQYISLMEALKGAGYSHEDAIKMAQTLMITNGKNNNLAGATAQTMAGVAAGQVAANEIRNNKQKTK